MSNVQYLQSPSIRETNDIKIVPAVEIVSVVVVVEFVAAVKKRVEKKQGREEQEVKRGEREKGRKCQDVSIQVCPNRNHFNEMESFRCSCQGQ